MTDPGAGEIAARVAAHPLFASLNEAGISAVTACAQEVAFDPDDVVFRVDEPADGFFLIEQGRVAVELDVGARPRLMISTVGAGGFLGVSWILPPYRWTFGARALEPVSGIRFDAADLRAGCEADHELGYELYKAVAGLVRDRLMASRLQLLDVYGDHDD